MYCLDKSRRLLVKSDYDYVFNQADKILTSEFIILYRKNALGFARIGLVISKKKIAKANQRNRLKRLVRESFRTHSLPAVDIVVLAREGAAEVENSLIITRLDSAWNKLNHCCVS